MLVELIMKIALTAAALLRMMNIIVAVVVGMPTTFGKAGIRRATTTQNYVNGGNAERDDDGDDDRCYVDDVDECDDEGYDGNNGVYDTDHEDCHDDTLTLFVAIALLVVIAIVNEHLWVRLNIRAILCNVLNMCRYCSQHE